MNRFYPLHVVTFAPRVPAPAASVFLDRLSGSGAYARAFTLPPGASFTVIVPEPGGLRTFRARTSLGLVPVPIGCAP